MRKYKGKIRLLDVHKKFQDLNFKGHQGVNSWRVFFDKTRNKKRNGPANKTKCKEEEEQKKESEHHDEQTNENSNSNESQTENQSESLKEGKDELIEEIDPLKKFYSEYKSFDEVPENNKKILPSMFPPKDDEQIYMNLSYTMRVHPQDNDSGGFFVAVFEKLDHINTINKPKDDEEQPEKKRVKVDDSAECKEKPKHTNTRRRQQTDLGNLPFLSLNDHMTNTVLPELTQFYGINTETFPIDQVKGRAPGETKCLYFVTEAILNSLLSKYKDGNSFQDSITVINTGLKIFSKNTTVSGARYRLNQDGIHCLVPHMDESRKIVVSLKDYHLLVRKALHLQAEKKKHESNINIYLEHDSNMNNNVDDIDNSNQSEKNGEKAAVELTVLDEPFDTEFVKQARQLTVGSFVVVLKGYEEDILNSKMAMVFWKSRADCINIMVAKEEIDGILSKVQALV